MPFRYEVRSLSRIAPDDIEDSLILDLSFRVASPDSMIAVGWYGYRRYLRFEVNVKLAFSGYPIVNYHFCQAIIDGHSGEAFPVP